MNAKGISVILCCHNSESRLKPTLDHLAKQRITNGIPWEIILVDNASTDQTTHLAKSVWQQYGRDINFKVVFEPNLGLMNARLRGFKSALFAYLCYIDDDNWLDVDYVQHVYNIFECHPEVAVCGGKSEAIFEPGLQLPSWFYKYQHAYAIGTQGETEGVVPDSRGYLWGAGISLRKSALMQLLDSGFKPLLTGRRGKLLTAGEDSELCYALRACGWKLWYSPQLKLRHFIPSFKVDWNYLLKMYKGFGAAQIFLEPYLLFLDKRKPIKSFKWFNHLRKDLKVIFKSGEKNILTASLKPKPGNNADIKAYRKFGKLIQKLKIAPWSYNKMYKEINKALQKAMLTKQKNCNK
jgi:glycosyltransferase involved in cell wall biosynthesis